MTAKEEMCGTIINEREDADIRRVVYDEKSRWEHRVKSQSVLDQN